ncbi:hypothetical protein BIW11_01582 [Tropilaelaps mercedesae]|uniref:Uncharacterized protein n=1 Tax=Tropilaelaps mercedesae TaxID=418985 RepID=A0A1V9XBS7_9ACAR|nr:hypothetical protein BIW11_01582 [Tropilaelaps mercedesae]
MTLAGGFLTSLASMPGRLPLPLPLVSCTYPDPLGGGPSPGGSRYSRATMRGGPLRSGLVGLGVLALAVGQASAQLTVDTVPELGLSGRSSATWWLTGSRTLWLLTLVLSCVVPLALAVMRRRRIAELIMKIPGPHVTHPVLGNLDVLFELNKYRHLLSPHIREYKKRLSLLCVRNAVATSSCF